MTTENNRCMDAAREIWEDLCGRKGFGLNTLEHDNPLVYHKVITVMAEIISKNTGVGNLHTYSGRKL